MIYRITALLLIFNPFVLSSQEFITELFFENSNGVRDTVYVGYDPSASIEIDTQFGEVDITSEPLSALGIRLSQTDAR